MSISTLPRVDTYEKYELVRDDLNRKIETLSTAIREEWIKNSQKPINPQKITIFNEQLKVIKSIFNRSKEYTGGSAPVKENRKRFEVIKFNKIHRLEKIILKLSGQTNLQKKDNFNEDGKQLHRIICEEKICRIKKNESLPTEPSKFPLNLKILTDRLENPLGRYNNIALDIQLNYKTLYEKFFIASKGENEMDKINIDACKLIMEKIRKSFVEMRMYHQEEIQSCQLQRRREYEAAVEICISSLEKALFKLFDRDVQKTNEGEQVQLTATV